MTSKELFKLYQDRANEYTTCEKAAEHAIETGADRDWIQRLNDEANKKLEQIHKIGQIEILPGWKLTDALDVYIDLRTELKDLHDQLNYNNEQLENRPNDLGLMKETNRLHERINTKEELVQRLETIEVSKEAWEGIYR